MFPVIDRRDFQPNFTKNPDSDEIDIGWNEGIFSDGRPYRLEFWAVSGLSMLTYFFSTIGIENYSQKELEDILVSNSLIEFLVDNPSVEAREVTDPTGNTFWSINIVLGDEENLYARDAVEIRKYGTN